MSGTEKNKPSIEESKRSRRLTDEELNSTDLFDDELDEFDDDDYYFEDCRSPLSSRDLDDEDEDFDGFW